MVVSSVIKPSKRKGTPTLQHLNVLRFWKSRQDSWTERGGGLYGHWSDSKPVVLEIREVISTSSSQGRFRFRVDNLLPGNLLGVWHTHARKSNHSLFDLYAYWQLSHLFGVNLLFLVFGRRDMTFHALKWDVTSVFPSRLAMDDVTLPSDWYKTVFPSEGQIPL